MKMLSMVERIRMKSRGFVAPLRATAGCALIFALTGCGGSSRPPAALPPSAGSTYTLMQMNLCLSGLAGCYAKVDYPAGVQDVIARIAHAYPDAVTLNETCSGDVALIARRTGYHLRFTRVIYRGAPLACVKPRGRGVFGDGVLTKAAILGSDSQPFASQSGPERRVWLCVFTRVGVEVCTAHLASTEIDEVAANAPQCVELRALLAGHAAASRAVAGREVAGREVARAVIFGGDVNRLPSCAPHGFWTRTDRAAQQDPGSQHVYGSGALRSPSGRVWAATHTDHDVLLVSATLAAQ